MYVDPGVFEFYMWVHWILLFIVAGMWLYGYGEPPEEGQNRNKHGDDFTRPSDDDEGWPGW